MKYSKKLINEKTNCIKNIINDTIINKRISERFIDGLVDDSFIMQLLEMDDFDDIFSCANRINQYTHGKYVDIRGIIEFSNFCKRQCKYCGLNKNNKKASRYRMSVDEIVDVGVKAYEIGYKTVVLQSGEDPYYSREILGNVIKRIKSNAEIKITLSCGELDFESLKYLKKCEADRYLLKHETSDDRIYSFLHPCGNLSSRIKCLESLKLLNYETGSGFMIGLPNQTNTTIARDILLLKNLKCDMAGIGPFIPHPETELKEKEHGSIELTKRSVAITRILLPFANLPATTSLGVIDSDEKRNIFECGANVIMNKLTPQKYLKLYEIYPNDIETLEPKKERKKLEDYLLSIDRIPR
ncbi:[FeFe] hydrogenase H-cluster radical SAM maturase HydE [Peptostreptococcus porci]|uniref:[FeFe] hydrogenase H-cluster radical SAM maturase HydE n=1 Tax=Peptostreptococcus porci TaxID=2652282 RepID=UPI002A908B46|nr:[FeFe] hydrogenase H-cluster radical SAM maturase HydE [Peptostreptococcus porci]MDY5437024.1 [FeFe] hydrogenase H-cluster radical SAM maturase HydE [Peptostreptococcus porci]MDY6233047.1 [FeFe] hydrogenase H-cluster radical SAM maturase HydE [Peptostreptococcus porci]